MALLDLIEQCPSACRWREAASQDEDYIRQARARQVETPRQKWAPRTSEYDLSAMLLANLTNIVGAMAENSRAIKKFEPIPAPRTAEGRVEAEESLKLTMSLIAQLTPYALDRG